MKPHKIVAKMAELTKSGDYGIDVLHEVSDLRAELVDLVGEDEATKMEDAAGVVLKAA